MAPALKEEQHLASSSRNIPHVLMRTLEDPAEEAVPSSKAVKNLKKITMVPITK